jgi:ABC-type multidrug transport system fused ATPase/permease subunit
MSDKSVKKLVYTVFLSPLLEKKSRLVFFILTLFLLAFAQSLFLLLIGPFLKTMFSLGSGHDVVKAAAFLSPKMQSLFPQIADKVFQKDHLILVVPGLLVFTALLKNIATYVYQVLTSYFGLLIAKRFRDRLFSAILKLPYLEISTRSAAEWMSLLMNDVLFLQNKFSDIANGLVRDSILILAAFVTLFFVHWPTALVLVMLTPFIAWGVGLTGKKISKYTTAIQLKIAQIADLVLEIRKRFEFIKAHKAEHYEQMRFRKLNAEYYQTIHKSFLVRSVFAPSLEFFSYAFFAGILIFFAQAGGLHNHFSASDMIVFLAALGTMMRPLRQIGEQLTQFHETRGAIEKSLFMFSSLSEKSEVSKKFKRNPEKQPHPIDIEMLCSGFGEHIVIEAGPLQIRAGQSIAIIGPSGGGKSSLLRTLSGLISPLKWDANLKQEDLASYSSFVSQIPFLFNETVHDNLNYGLDTKREEHELKTYFDLIPIQEEISKLSNGLNTHIKAISSNISGGQRQRLVLIRALMRDKPVLLLDEATSSVDPRMEEEIIDKLLIWGRAQGRSIVSVTHRLGMLHKYDEIWFVENGKISARGTFYDLMDHERFKIFYNASL